MTSLEMLLAALTIVQTVAGLGLHRHGKELKRQLGECIAQKRQYFTESQELRRKLSQAAESLKRGMEKLMLAGLVIGMSIAALPSPSWAQSVGSIVSNGQLQNREFSLLLIHADDQLSGPLLRMLTSPQSQKLRGWTDGLHLRVMHVSEPFIQHHVDLLQKHQNQFPILALVDSAGGAWWSAAGNQLATSEISLVQQMSQAYVETLRAAAAASPLPVPVASPSVQSSYDNGGPSRFLDRGVSAPDPINIPSVNITTGVPQAPAEQPASDETLLLIGVLCVVCSLILAASVPIGSTIIAAAMTDEPAE